MIIEKLMVNWLCLFLVNFYPSYSVLCMFGCQFSVQDP